METVRFAPSPTGWLHLGHAFGADFAQRAADGGTALLRIEDIERDRVRPLYVEGIFEDLAWLGFHHKEPVLYQSHRSDLYRQALAQLHDLGALYPCFCSRKQIAAADALGAPHPGESEAALPYPGTCRSLTKSEREERIGRGEAYAWRLDLSKSLALTGPLTWQDRKLGVQPFQNASIGDPILARRDIPFSYHLCCTVDDAAQGVTLVTRAADLIEITPIHRILQALLKLPAPCYWHHPLVGDGHGHRLSKRDHAISLRWFRENGFTPSQVLELATERLLPPP